MNQNNIILATDSYKLTHWNQYPKDTQAVYSYFESRTGAKYPYTVFFGLQAILRKLEGKVVTAEDVVEAKAVADWHLGPDKFNLAGWNHIVEEHEGKLPLRIQAVSEGTPVAIDNVLMTVENTCEECYWLTNALESLLTHVWYPSAVATLSRVAKEHLVQALAATSDNPDAVDFMLHDFGYRGATSDESAAIGGAGHLVNFKGTDTLPALLLASEQYNAPLDTLAFSVPATEHSVMTALGKEGEMKQVGKMINENPTGIVSIVADSYNYYDFVEQICTTFKNHVLLRDGKVVVRPDSITQQHPTPALLTTWTLERLWESFGGTVNSKGFKVLDPHIGVLWGDGIDVDEMVKICARAQLAGFSTENLVFGMGGGLLQKVNRDTQRSAFKCSATKRDGVWHDVQKSPLDSSKKSKAGRLQLTVVDNQWMTYRTDTDLAYFDRLETVFENGEIMKRYTFDEVRENASVNTNSNAM